MSKLRHWLANQLQTLYLLGPKKWAQGNALAILLGLVLGLFVGSVFGATAATVTEGTYSLRQGNTNVQTGIPGLQACIAAAQARSESQRVSRTYNCDKTADRVAVTYTPDAPPPPPPPPIGWTRAAGEGESFRLYAAATVRYGADTRWNTFQLTAGTYPCTNARFGPDPAYNTLKDCEVNPASALQAGPATGVAALSWQAPALYTDGTALPPSELSAFRIYQGTSAGTLNRVAEVGGGVRSHTVQSLPAGTHYFAVSAVAGGVESALSGVGSKAVP